MGSRAGAAADRGADDAAVDVTDHGPVRVLSFNNPSKRNALDDRLRRGLSVALDAALRAETVQALVLTGEGGTFCAGGDLASMPTSDSGAIRARMSEMHVIIRTLIAIPIPVIAAVEGFAFGSGLSIVAACDVVVAAADARFGAPFGRVGLVADCGLLWTLPRLVGAGRTRSLVLSAEPWTAQIAADSGLVDTVSEPGKAVEAAIGTAAAIAGMSPLAAAATKRLLADIQSLDRFLDQELDEQTKLLQSDDFSEGRAAFFDRRPARFTGA